MPDTLLACSDTYGVEMVHGRSLKALLAFACGAVAGCQGIIGLTPVPDPTAAPMDAGHDASDAGEDAADAGGDVSVDAGHDASDARLDAGSDG